MASSSASTSAGLAASVIGASTRCIICKEVFTQNEEPILYVLWNLSLGHIHKRCVAYAQVSIEFEMDWYPRPVQ